MTAADPTRLVIQAHPVPDSFNGALLEAVVGALTGPHGAPVTARLCDGDDPGLDSLESATTLVFVHPTWWGGPPAILLDWIERRLGPWIDEAPSEPSPIRSVEHLAVVTTHGSPQLLNRMTGEPGKQLYRHSILPLAAPGCSWKWLAHYGMDADDPTKRAAFLASLPNGVRP